MKRINPHGYDTDKADLKHYFAAYEAYFAPFEEKEVVLFEMGIHKGGSLQIWRDYFEKGTIIGLDKDLCIIDDESGRISTYRGHQEDTVLLDRIAMEHAPGGFDIIIDDCSHIGELSRISFWHLFQNHLKPGGIYTIEDWGTGYWPAFPDGHAFAPSRKPSLSYRIASSMTHLLRRLLPESMADKASFLLLRAANHKKRFPSHSYGMVGFVKELIDEMAMADITCQGMGTGTFQLSLFKQIYVNQGHVIVFKADADMALKQVQ
jgi:hypothetical protein